MTYQIQKQLAKEIFRTYDIRGIVEEELNENILYTIGLALGSEAIERHVNSINVGRDGRLSGPLLMEALISGILDSGCHVAELGEVTTPMVYYAASMSQSNSGIALSGSHNPPHYNGIKIVLKGEALYGEAITQIYQRIIEQRFQTGKGVRTLRSINQTYQEEITSKIHLARPLRVAIDCGNGVGGKFAPSLFRALGCEVHQLFCEIDGNFPNHQPDPADPKNLTFLQTVVQQGNYEVGLAFDGDADRVGIISELGEIIPADRLLALFALDLLKRHKDKPIIFDVKCGRQIKEQIERHGGIPMRYRTGHSLIKAKMRETGAYLAGELSGHIFMKENWFGFDDGLYVAARFLELLAKKPQTVSQIFAKIPQTYSTPEIKISVAEKDKFSIMEYLIHQTHFEGDIDLIDGLRVDFPNGFGLIRPSNTTPYLIACFEGDQPGDLEKIKKIFKRELSRVAPQLQLPF